MSKIGAWARIEPWEKKIGRGHRLICLAEVGTSSSQIPQSLMILQDQQYVDKKNNNLKFLLNLLCSALINVIVNTNYLFSSEGYNVDGGRANTGTDESWYSLWSYPVTADGIRRGSHQCLNAVLHVQVHCPSMRSYLSMPRACSYAFLLLAGLEADVSVGVSWLKMTVWNMFWAITLSACIEFSECICEIISTNAKKWEAF